jgi:hypothetical protein
VKKESLRNDCTQKKKWLLSITYHVAFAIQRDFAHTLRKKEKGKQDVLELYLDQRCEHSQVHKTYTTRAVPILIPKGAELVIKSLGLRVSDCALQSTVRTILNRSTAEKGLRILQL